ncbi:MAG: putative ABC exporter domain-containing protein [Acetatifactor sp.]|nr:putative ABC exporter domain-containing protein [Acetatifactor sp.]
MRLFLYYAVHSFLNQLKKIFKSWAVVFILVCVVFGAIIGVFAASVSEVAEKKQAEQQVEQQVESEEAQESQSPDSAFKVMLRDEVGYGNFLELIVAAVFTMILAFSVLGADKNAGRIFLPADVTLLFSAPMKPQSVMMFRIANQLGQMLLIGFYMLFQLPNLILNAGMSIWAAIAMVVAFCLANFFSTLFQLLFYLIGNVFPTFKKMLRPGLVVCLALIVGPFFLYQKSSGLGILPAAASFFNAKGTQWIPVWGWMKGFCRAAYDADLAGTLLFLVLLAVSAVVMIYVIWSLKVDFYEDAMAKSEEIAALMEAARSQNGIITKKKDRSEKLCRDGMKHGAGANVFFWKSWYNRVRFSHFGFLTKTMEFYLIVAIAVGLICRFSIETNNVLVLVAILAGMVFFRSLGNPLETDVKMSYFVMIPESTWAKLFYSLLASIVSTMADLALPLVVGALVMGGNPLVALIMILPILSVDVYSTLVGAFINISLPANAALTIKQFIQILFVYFGLLPDIFVLVFAVVLGHVWIGIIAAFVVNQCLSFLFFVLTALWLEPHGGTEEGLLEA